MSILVVVAHPDDETLGCGGTIAKLVARGERLHVAILCKSRADKQTEGAVLRLCQPGGFTLDLYNKPDQRLDTYPLTKIAQYIERLIDQHAPATVYTHHPGDLNRDHQITYQAVMTACRPVNNCPVRTVYAMEIPSSSEWGDGTFRPTTYVDITATLDRKIAAMEMYETERRPFPHPRSPEALRALAHIRGAAAGLEAAEAFQLIRHIQTP